MTRAGSPGVPARSRGMADAGLSIVVPLFNEAANLASLHARLVASGESLLTNPEVARLYLGAASAARPSPTISPTEGSL